MRKRQTIWIYAAVVTILLVIAVSLLGGGYWHFSRKSHESERIIQSLQEEIVHLINKSDDVKPPIKPWWKPW